MSLYNASVPQLVKMLGNLERWLDKAAEHTSAEDGAGSVPPGRVDIGTLLAARLAPDQYPLARQVQAACDAAKFAAAYLTGQKAPTHPDTETTMAQLRERVGTCLRYLESVPADDYAGADDRKVAPPWLQGKWMKGSDFLVQVAAPNFYFHATTAYAILRHNGVDVGKLAYLGSMPIHDQ